MAERVGQQFGQYRLSRFLGQGSFSEVYLGEHIYNHTLAAVKVLQVRLTTEDLKEFINEASATFRLQHPHIVRLLDFGISPTNTPFLVMAYAANGTLRQRHPKGTRLPLERIVAYVSPIASALQHAHDERLIHRDIKPENMLLGPNNEVWLSDFGITSVAHSTRSLDIEKPGGTVPYMAPEQLRGKARPASDQYALGILVYEWLCGVRPFSGTATEIAMQHLLEPPPSLREKMPTISPEVEQVVMTALEKDPKERFASILAFATAFEQACQSEASSLSPSSRGLLPSLAPVFSEPSLPPPQEDPIAIMSPESSPLAGTPLSPPLPVTVQVLNPALELEPGMALQPGVKTLPEQSIASEPPPATSEAPAIQRPLSRRSVLIGGGVLVGLAAVGGGLWLANSQRAVNGSPAANHPATQTAIPPTATSLPLGTILFTYRGHSQLVRAAVWSPNGTRIATGSYDWTVQVWDAFDGSNVFIYKGHDDPVEAVTWSPNGTRIASGSDDRTVQVWDANNGGNVFTYEGHDQGHTNWVMTVAWSPNGTRIASGDTDGTVQVWDASDGGNVYTSSKSLGGVAWSPNGMRIATSGDDGTVQVWDASNGGNVFTYKGHSGFVRAVAWSPDGKRIASASIDGTVQVWDASNGSNAYSYRGHSAAVNSVAWSFDGKHIASASDDETVQVWVAS
jgi:serine/threonine protein kinase